MPQDEDDDFFYQPHQARGQRLDPAIRRMALGAGGIALVIIVTALAYSGFHAGSFGPPPIINPPATPLRVAPASPGGMVVPGADVPIMSGQLSPQAAPELAAQAQGPELAQLNQAAGISAPPAPAPPPPVPAFAPASAAGALTSIQLAATPDEPGAQTTWAALQKKFPSLLGGKTPVILPAVVNGASVWRLRLSGFASPDDAKNFCAKLTAQKAACSVAAF